MNFLTQNSGTIAVLAVLILIIALIINKIRRDKKQGKSGCGCGCDGCANKGLCHPENNPDSKNTKH